METTPSPFSRFFGLFNIARAIRDFRDVWVQDNPYRLRFLAVSAAATWAIFSVMFAEEHRIAPRPPELIIIETLPPGRSDAEIEAANIANQQRKDEARAAREAREARQREIYEAIGRASGIDVEEARRQGEAERAAAEQARAQARKEALERVERSN